MTTKTISIQRLRNLTTGRLHTEMQHIYEDIEFIVGEKGIMTHMIPNARKALLPYLIAAFPEPRLWDGTHDTTHEGNVELKTMNADQQAAFWESYEEKVAKNPPF